ncbi:ABC transporter permease [Verrucomicrobiaceae bacterium N1E253]|uniref:ABC transporter permease n=2 Tax=Oceaniferula marina TaxID=2748318 RepID=A0A851GEH1_9BACT|nr:ABC transporter permease [Oceaniferula marina]
MVLIVVLSVFGGFEQLVKERVLSYTPHILLQRIAPWPDPEQFPEYNAEEEWRAVEQSMTQLDGVESAYALINDPVLLDRHGAIAPASMQAIDAANLSQVAALEELIKPGNGNADMGMGETAVVSSLTAEKFGISLGDVIQIHSSRNLQEIKPALDRIGTEAFATTHAEVLSQIKADITRITSVKDDQEAVPIEELQHLYYNQIQPLLDYNIRNAEKQILDNTLRHLETFTSRSTPDPDTSGDFLFPKGHMAKAIALLDQLKDVDLDQEDITNVKQMKTIILPKDLEVIGIYQATRHAYSPDVFVPLPIGQDLLGIGDGVRGIALRLDEPYDAQKVLDESILPNMPKNGLWSARTWMEDHQQQLGLIKTQRQLLTVSLSFIMLVSAFSIMAVMFTVTIQKKREIGVMKALGATPAQLVRVFLYQGILIGLFGGIIGLTLGNLVLDNLQSILDLFASWGFDPFPSDFNGFDGLPVIKQRHEFIAVFLFAFILCTLATLVPAMVASKSDAAKSLRNM